MNIKEMEELAMKFCSKLPNETNFNNNKTRKYFSGTHKHTLTKGSLCSSDTIRMSYKTCRRSKYSIFNSEKSNFTNLIQVSTLFQEVGRSEQKMTRTSQISRIFILLPMIALQPKKKHSNFSRKTSPMTLNLTKMT
jgi:hypothetical protein